ncbi:MAG: hypothetical protein ABSD58_04460 [Verrucomicrobiia bacterium]
MIRINQQQRLFVLPAGDNGFGCLGFDVCEERTRTLAAELAVEPMPHRKGTRRAYEAYERLVEVARQRNQATGWRAQSELTHELLGLEGKRVEIVDRWGHKRRFYVGKSTGFIPVHLEIARRNSTGGPAVMGAPFNSVRVLEQSRYQ